MSVSDKFLPREIDFKILVVASPTFGFFVLAETDIPINGTVPLIAGLRNLLHAIRTSEKFFQFTF